MAGRFFFETEEHSVLREQARRFGAREIAPGAASSQAAAPARSCAS